MTETTTEDKTQVFNPYDLDLWRMYVRNQRKRMGYDKATHFVQTLWLRTRVKINVQTFYKIEQGKQEPTIAQFMAINMALSNHELPDEEIHKRCLCREWQQIKTLNEDNNDTLNYEQKIPPLWAEQNFKVMKEEHSLSSDRAAGVALVLNEPFSLFHDEFF